MTIFSRRNAIIATAALVGAAATGAYFISDDAGTATYFAENGIALRGADPVAYFTEENLLLDRQNTALSGTA